MAQFGYRTQRKMPPRPGRTYATVYYQQTTQERQRVHQHVSRTIQQVGERALAEPELAGLLAEPFQRRRETDACYTGIDIMSDLWSQLESGKDIPAAMLGRWNKFFAGIDPYQIHMVLDSELPARSRFQQLFEEK